MINCLAGRIEIVYIERIPKRTKGNGAIEKFKGIEVHVSNGKDYAEKNCLVRFDLKMKKRSIPISNFLTSRFKDEGYLLNGLAPEKYVLLGLWTEKMARKRFKAPTFEELEKYYNPGRKDFYYFFQNNSSYTEGRIKVDKYCNMNRIRSTFSRIIRKELPKPYKSSRLIVVEGKEQLEQVKKIIEENELEPIELENLVF